MRKIKALTGMGIHFLRSPVPELRYTGSAFSYSTMILSALLFLPGSDIHAANITKSDTTTMNTAADWGGSAPTIADHGYFTSVLSAGNAANLSLGGNVSLLRLEFQNINGPVTIAAGNTLTMSGTGNSSDQGIDMMNAALNHNVTINAAIVNTGTIGVKAGRTLTLGGGASNIQRVNGGGSLLLNTGTYGFNEYLNLGNWANPATTGVVIGNSATASIGAQYSIGRGANGIVRVNGTGAQFTATPGNQDLSVGRDNTKGLLQVDEGNLTIGRAAFLGNGGSSEGILRINGGTATVGANLNVLMNANNAAASGTFEVNGGTTTVGGQIILGSGSTAGSADMTVTGGTLYIGRNGVGIATSGTGSTTHSITLSGGTIGSSTTTGGGGWSSSANMTLGTVNGDITFQAANALAAARTITLTGILSGSGGLKKTGAGTLSLGAANTYSGQTRIDAGTLSLTSAGSLNNSSRILVGSGAIFNVDAKTTGSGTFTIQSGQTLGGSGTVKGTSGGTVLMASGSTLSPGLSPGTITFDDVDLTLDAGSSTFMEIAGDTAGQYDVISGDGGNTITFGGALRLAFMNDALPTTQKLYLFTDWQTYDGDFASIQQVGRYIIDTVTFDVDGDGGYVEWSGEWSLAPIPEPGTLVLFCVGVFALFRLRRNIQS